MTTMRMVFFAGIILTLLLPGCGGQGRTGHTEEGELKMFENATIIDVRTPEEFAKAHIAGAINVPVDQVENRIAEVAKSKNEPLILHCQSGRRSASAKKILERMGYANVQDLGSFENARQKLEK